MVNFPILDIIDLTQRGCEIARLNGVVMLVGLYAATNNKPCAECNCKQTCVAWESMTPAERQYMRETSVSQVEAKRRRMTYTSVSQPEPKPKPVPVRTANDVLQTVEFIEACQKAGVEPTVRQANKYLRGEGAAWKAHHADHQS